jgi:hypothetical protein
MSVDKILQQSMSAVPECVAGGVVDLASGMLLGVKSVDSHPTEVMDLLAAATTDLFQGVNVQMIEEIFRKARGVSSGGHYFQEIVVNSENLIHIFMRGRKNTEQVVCFVCRKGANLGMVLTKARGVLPEIEAVL